MPVHLGWKIGSSLYDSLSEKEKTGISEAAMAIYGTYLTAIESLE
jgi:hypothetical protein